MESRQRKLQIVRSVFAAPSPAGVSGWLSGPIAGAPGLVLAKRALQIALVIFVPGGAIVLALLWWFDQRGNT
jgi:hypothetical protein